MKEFKKMVTDNFIRFMGEEFSDSTIEIQHAYKVNKVLDALIILSKKGAYIAPTLYIQDMYLEYILSGDTPLVTIKKVAERYAAIIRESSFSNKTLADDILLLNEDCIVYQVINTMQNEELLKNIPHRPFLDLSIIYLWMTNDGDDIVSTIITNKLAKHWNLTESQLYTLAEANTFQRQPSIVQDMEQALFGSDYISENENKRELIYIVSNQNCINGANAILNKTVLQNMADYLMSDLFILPSSLHELLLVSAESVFADVDVLAKMVYQVNQEKVDLEDRLSNQIYRYSRSTKLVTQVTNVEDSIK